VHSNSLWAHLDCALAGHLARRPSIIELYDLVRPGLGRTVLTAAAALSTNAVAISQAVADIIGPRGSSHVRIVPLSVDLDRFGPGPSLRRCAGISAPTSGRRWSGSWVGSTPKRVWTCSSERWACSAAPRLTPIWSWWEVRASLPTAIPSACG